jgi:glycosyltransferase involved in cell wall biosynthesis
LRKKAIQYGVAERVRFVGQRSDVARLLIAADIFCQPNTVGEPFGISFIEALHAQLPVVTTDLGAAREIVDDTCGLLVPPDDAHALALAVGRLIQEPDLRKQLGSAGPARASELCNPGVQMDQFQAALSGVIRQRQDN